MAGAAREEIVRRLYRGFNAAGPDLTLADVVAEDAVFDWSRRKLDPRVVRGRAAVFAALRELTAPWAQYSVELERLYELGDSVLALATVKGRGRVSGIEMSSAVAHLWTFRDEKVVEMVYYPHRDEALAAHGLAD